MLDAGGGYSTTDTNNTRAAYRDNYNPRGSDTYYQFSPHTLLVGLYAKTENESMVWNSGYKNIPSDKSKESGLWNIEYENVIEKENEVYITVTLDIKESLEKDLNGDGIKEDYYRQKVYVNGKEIKDDDTPWGFDKNQWDKFINSYLKDLKYFCVGRSSMAQPGYWHYSTMDLKAIRLYSRALTEDEVLENYNKTKEYNEN